MAEPIDAERRLAVVRSAFDGEDPLTTWDGLTADQIANKLANDFGETPGTARFGAMWWSIRDALRSFARQVATGSGSSPPREA